LLVLIVILNSNLPWGTSAENEGLRNFIGEAPDFIIPISMISYLISVIYSAMHRRWMMFSIFLLPILFALAIISAFTFGNTH